MTAFDSLIAEFSEKTGVQLSARPEGSPHHDGSVSIEADGIYITVQCREARGDAILFSFPLGDMKPEPATMEKALELNAHGLGTDGFYLGISSGAFVLSGAMPVEGTSAEDFAKMLLSLAAATVKVETALARAIADYAEAEVGREESSAIAGNLSVLHV